MLTIGGCLNISGKTTFCQETSTHLLNNYVVELVQPPNYSPVESQWPFIRTCRLAFWDTYIKHIFTSYSLVQEIWLYPIHSTVSFAGTGRFLVSSLVCLPSWVGGLCQLRDSEETGSELSSWLWKQKSQSSVPSFHIMMLNCEMRSVPHANGQQETSNVARNWCSSELPLTTTNLVGRHPPWPGSCRSWYVLTPTSHPKVRETETETDSWLVCLPSWVGGLCQLRDSEETGSELSS